MPAPQKKKGGMGATVGIVIIVILLIFGGLYFWGERLNQGEPQQLPLIPGDTTTQQ
jgi:hypothetical protein